MNKLEFSFEPAPWEQWLGNFPRGASVPAGGLLTLLEGEEEQELEDALQAMEEAGMELDIRDLPKSFGSGETALRLRQEQQLAQKGISPDALEENDPLRLYLEEIAAIPVCGDEDLLAQDAAAGKESAANALTNLGLSRVVEMAGAFTGYGVLLTDLIQEGSLGLWKAVGSYREGEYSAFRDRWIRFYLARAVALQARSSGVGERLRQAMEDYRQVDQRLLSDLGRNATVEEIAQELHLSVEQAESVRAMLENARLLQQAHPSAEDEETPEEAEQAVENTAAFQMHQRIADLLSSLEPEEARLLTLRFGLEGGKPMTPQETGRILGLTPDEVVAREAAALTKLRK